MSTTATTPPATTPTTAQPGQTGAIPRLIDLLVVGAGFAGLYMLHKARQLGLSVQVIEAAPGVGGTWYHNRYPGARVDIQSMEYSYSFDEDLQQQWQWTERFSAQPELLKYANHVADRFDLRRHLSFATRVTSATWDDAGACWAVALEPAGGASGDGAGPSLNGSVPRSAGEVVRARFLVSATGVLSVPFYPDVPGREDFAGVSVHTGRWPTEPVDLAGKRVAVIGTGSSGVQIIPNIVDDVASLTVYQRTANWCTPLNNRPISDEEQAELRAGFGPGIVTALVRMEGRPLGVLANDPAHLGGAIDRDAADKAARFLQLCDAHGLDVLYLCDTPGFLVGPEAEAQAQVRHFARLFVTAGSMTVPFGTVVLRKGYGLGAQAMAGGSFRAGLFTLSWPTGEFGGMGLEGAVKLGFRRELEAIEDPVERQQAFDQMVAAAYRHGEALNMAAHLELDDVIDPAETRARVLDAFRSATGFERRGRPFVDTW